MSLSTKFYKIDFFNNEDYQDFNKICKDGKIIKILDKSESELWVYIAVDDKHINLLIELLSYLPVKEFSNIKESLEDYFMKFYKEDKDFGGAL